MVDVPPITSDLRYVMCLYPKLITNRKYVITKKNKGIIPFMKDKRVSKVAIGCGRCIECAKQKRNEWLPRITEDIKEHKNSNFVTLTFNEYNYWKLRDEILSNTFIDDEYTIDNQIATLAVRRYLERWRKKYKKSVRHWLVTELGTTSSERIHIHGLIYTDNKTDINDIWKYGFTHVGDYVNENTIKYITKYITKTDFNHKEYKPIILCSPGIGKSFLTHHNSKLNRYQNEQTKETYTFNDGKISSLPKYYRNRLYTEDEREQLWLNLLAQLKLQRQHRLPLQLLRLAQLKPQHLLRLRHLLRLEHKHQLRHLPKRLHNRLHRLLLKPKRLHNHLPQQL